jgi:hypothetical protein
MSPDGGNRSDKTQRFTCPSQKAGFEGPYAGGKHQFMIKGNLRLTIPNPHKADIGSNLLSKASNKQA